MSAFDLNDILHLASHLLDKSPFDALDFVDDIKLIDEKNSFYKNARRQYQESFLAIEKEYHIIKELMETNATFADQSIFILNGLTAKKTELEKLISDKVIDLTTQHNISAEDVWFSLNSGSVLISNDTRPMLSNLFHSIHKSKQNSARQDGYAKAKKEFEIAVKNIICDLAQRKANECNELQEILDKILKSFIAVSENYMKITELEIISENTYSE